MNRGLFYQDSRSMWMAAWFVANVAMEANHAILSGNKDCCFAFATLGSMC